MRNKHLLLLLTLTITGLTFSESDALARGWHYRRVHYRRPPPQRPPPAPPKAPTPKTLQSSGTVWSLSTRGKSLSLRDDNTKSVLNLTITPQTSFSGQGKPILAESIRPYTHVTVSYLNTDNTLKEVRITPPPAAALPAGATGRSGKAAKAK